MILRRSRGTGKKMTKILAGEKILNMGGGPGDGADTWRQVHGDAQGPHQ